MLKRVLCGATLGAALTAASAFGGVIDFNTLTGATTDPFTTYTEGGFTVNATGTWEKAFSYGNPAPDIYLGTTVSASPGSITITDAGADFTFVSVDLSPNNGTNASYTITGSLLGVTQFTETGTDSALTTFSTISTISGAAIDSLVIALTPNGNTSVNVDNIVYGAAPIVTPEPATLSLFLFGGLGLAGWKRVRATRRPQ